MKKTNKTLLFLSLILSMGLIVSCSNDDDPGTGGDGEEEEEISEVVLTFTPDEGSAVVAIWSDSDGEGGANPSIDDIDLVEGVEYTLTLTLTNTLTDPDEDITEEIEEEADEHQFFFQFSEGYFSDPTGDGNFDNKDDAVNYNDFDSNSLPVGLSTSWTAGAHSEEAGDFRIVLKHQPDQKDENSDASVGGTDIDITFPLNIVEDPNEEEEEINQVVLTFTPSEGDPITATWFDADGEGAGSPEIDDIDLNAGVEYTMTITLTNTLGEEDEDITAEIEEEDDEHMFFFEFTNNIFSDPTGNGNADDRDDAVNYNDFDDNSLPVGLSTDWTAGSGGTGTFRVVLKHQPGLKTADSDIDTGGTDIDISFDLNIID